MRSANASTLTRSIAPFSNARRVNSPRFAGRIFGFGISARASVTAAITARDPCRCNSTTSSVVKERGAGKCNTRARSSKSPVCGWCSARKDAVRGFGSVLLPVGDSRDFNACVAAGPDILITATPAAATGPVANA